LGQQHARPHQHAVAEALTKLIDGLERLEHLEARLVILEQRAGIAPPPAAATTTNRSVH
jgi:hypothetical protein